MKITIDVTSDDIAGGKRLACEKCPVALAVSRRVVGTASVSKFYISIDGFLVKQPPTVKSFIRDFDNQRTVKPFSFDLKLPAEIVRPV